LPYIGSITAVHLAKNLGFNVAKPDRHLVRLSRQFGYICAADLCSDIAKDTGEQVKVIDLALWRYMADVRPLLS
jgi:thermostable 8-oxoguanine DNA glycosylase